jgi:hypothetical protein
MDHVETNMRKRNRGKDDNLGQAIYQSVADMIRGLTDKIRRNGCAVLVFTSGRENPDKKNLGFSHQTTLIEHMSREVVE